MRNLLSAYITKMIKDKFFWLIECVIMVLAVYVFGFANQNFVYGMHHVSTEFTTNLYFFNITFWLGISLALYSAYFVGSEYHNGILRNQIISGHKRYVIYLSHCLVILLAGILQAAAYFLVFLLSDGLFLGFSALHMLVRPAEYFLLIFLALLGYSALFSCLSILLGNRSVILFVQLLLAALMLHFGYTAVNALLEPETILITNSYYGENKTIPNPKYLTGTEREFYEWADALIPSSISLHGAMTEKTDRLPFSMKMPAGTVLLSVSFTACGLYGFSRKDVK